jgi:Tol biopolymer transport system component
MAVRLIGRRQNVKINYRHFINFASILLILILFNGSAFAHWIESHEAITNLAIQTLERDGKAAELDNKAAGDKFKAIVEILNIYITDVLDSNEKNIRLLYRNDLQPRKEISGFFYPHILTPSWSPDGQKIGFMIYYPEERGGAVITACYVYSFINGATLKVASELITWIGQISWSPDSKKIVSENYIIDVNIRSLKKIINDFKFIITHSNWSPDGRWITYSTTRDIYLFNPVDGNSVQLTFDENTKGKIMNNFPSWVDNKTIMFERWYPRYMYADYIEDNNSEVCIIDIQSRKVNILTEKGCALTKDMWSQS